MSTSQSQTKTRASILAWALLGLTLTIMGAGMALDRAASALDSSLVETIALTASFMAFPIVGALIASRHPKNAIGWIFVGIGLLVAVLVTGTAYARYGLVLHPDKNLPLTTLGAWIEAWTWLPLIGVIPTLLLLLFPTGRPPSRRWRPLAWITGFHLGIITVLSMLEERLRSDRYSIDNPIGIGGLGDVEQMDFLLLPFIPLALLCACSLFFRYRAAPADERQQLKWVAVAAAFFVSGVLVGDFVELPEFLFPIFLGSLPAAVGVAILRYRLYDIDVIINRTLVYGALTGTLAGAYLGLVVVLQQVLAPITTESDLAIAASTLVVAGLFRPARTRIQSFIDRRFYRSKYDAVQTLQSFSARLRDEVDLDDLRTDLLGVVGSTVAPAHASLWLKKGVAH